MPPEFDRYIAIDWSGARGARHKGIAIGVIEASGEPWIERPQGGIWSREAVADWVMSQSGRSGRCLIGFDFSFSLPFLDEGRFLPGISDSYQAVWDAVENISAAETDLFAGPFVSRYQDHFLTGQSRGASFMPRLRVTEHQCRLKGYGRAESCYHLIGPTQVGLGSFAGMRLLRRAQKNGAAIWPFDGPGDGLTIVEIYTRLFLTMADVGRVKLRDRDALARAVSTFGASGANLPDRFNDHEGDVLLSAVAMRYLHRQSQPVGQSKSGLSGLWRPDALSDKVRRTEGWTWGVV